MVLDIFPSIFSEISGEGRYQCFSSGPLMDGNGRHVEVSENMDESDPVNDLEDFRTEIGHKVVGIVILLSLFVNLFICYCFFFILERSFGLLKIC